MSSNNRYVCLVLKSTCSSEIRCLVRRGEERRGNQAPGSCLRREAWWGGLAGLGRTGERAGAPVWLLYKYSTYIIMLCKQTSDRWKTESITLRIWFEVALILHNCAATGVRSDLPEKLSGWIPSHTSKRSRSLRVDYCTPNAHALNLSVSSFFQIRVIRQILFVEVTKGCAYLGKEESSNKICTWRGGGGDLGWVRTPPARMIPPGRSSG